MLSAKWPLNRLFHLSKISSTRPLSNQRWASTSGNTSPPTSLPALFFDIDGVLTRGGATIPAALQAFEKIYDRESDRFKIPVVFVTNAGNTLNTLKAEDLTRILGCRIDSSQVIMSHTPLGSLTTHHQNFSLISGQGPIKDIANQLGFKNHITVDEVRDLFPYLDMVNQQTRPKKPTVHQRSEPAKIPKIEQIVMFGEPQVWDTNLQFLVDCLLTDGDFWQRSSQQDYENFGVLNPEIRAEQMPLIGANMDLQWQAEAPGPRFGHGMFLNILESSYKKLTGGRDLEYTALAGKPATLTYKYAEDLLLKMTREQYGCDLSNVYCIGDNLMSDIYGANMYTSQENRDFKSMLVCTGVYHPDTSHLNDLEKLKENINSININHAPRDYQDYILKEKGLLKPDYLFEDVHGCVDFVLRKEGIDA